MSENNDEKFIEYSPKPITIEGTEKILFQMKNSICKIYKCNGTGFFFYIPYKNAIFKALITNYNIINDTYVKNNQIIKISMNDDKVEIDIEIKNRKIYLSEKYDTTIIEIKNSDKNINVNYLELDDNIFKNNSEFYYEKSSVYVLQYPNMNKASVSYGILKKIQSNNITHSCCTQPGSSGSPILNLFNNKIIGIHRESTNLNFNIGSFIKSPINEFIQNGGQSNLNNNIVNEINNVKQNNIGYNGFNNIYSNEINLIYFTQKEGSQRIFGDKFVENNKRNIDLIINGAKTNLIGQYKLQQGENNIKLIIKNKISNLEYMFNECKCLKNIDGLKNLDTKGINNFEHMFNGCSLLSDINGLYYWNVSNSNNFSFMFCGCSSLTDINGLSNWNVSNANNFKYMFCECSSLSNVNGLQNWNVSNVNGFSFMFCECSSLSNINGLQNWNVSNAKNFEGMFRGCSSLSELNGLQNWNVSNVNNFSWMFYKCSSLSNINGLQNWNVSNSKDFSWMFSECLSSLDLKSLLKWKISESQYKSMKY